MEEKIIAIPIAEIRSNPYQPRKIFNEDAIIELANSIKQNGVFQPIIVRKSSVLGYELIAGERRLKAAKLAGKSEIPAVVRILDESKMMEISVVENLQREDLTPLEEALAYQSLIEKLNLNQTQLAKKLGKSRPYITNYLRLLGLPRKVKEYLQKNQLSMAQARTLLSLKNSEKIEEVSKKAIDEGLTVRNLAKLVEKINNEKILKKQVTDKNIYLEDSEEKLSQYFGTKVKVTQNQKNKHGKIEIEYLSTEDLNRILDIFKLN